MRKKLLVIISFLFLFSLTLLNFNVKAESSVTVETVQGAEIRTTSPSGLRFTGVTTGDWASLGTEVSYGFLLSKGTFTKDEMVAKLATGKAIASLATGINEHGEFYLTIINIPAMGYEKNITALAYVEVDGVKYYSEQAITRNILQVAKAWSEDPEYPGNEFNDRIINTSTFILNGGSFNINKSLVVGAYNSGNNGTAGITLCTKANQSKGSGGYWYKAALKQNALDANLFTIVQTAVSGKTIDSTLDYDYVIAAWENDKANYSELKSACENNNYLYFSSFAAGANVFFVNNYEILLGNKVYVAQNESLPLVSKDYYSFDGWYNNPTFEGEAVITHASTNAITYYAKYTPIDYTISVDLQGGTCNVEIPTTYNYESSEIILPTASEMTIANGSFVGWYENAAGTGEPITKITTNSSGDLKLYAVWEMETINELAISNVDVAVLNSKSPNIIVNSSLTVGNYSLKGTGLNVSYNDVIYKYGDNAFASIVDALAVANENDAIYVMSGTYTDEFTVSTKGLYIYGPNYGVSANSGSPVRNTEAVISSVVNINASNVVLDGVKLTGNSYINILSSATELQIRNLYSDSAGMSAVGSGGNRKATVYAANSCTGLTVCDSYFNVGSTTYCRDAITLYGTAENITIERNYITNSTTAPSTSEAIQFGTASGTIIIKDNSIIYPTGNCVLYMASGSAKIDIINNIISGKSSTLYTSTIRLTAGKSDGVVNIIGNDFSFVEPNTFNLASTVVGHVLNIKYNYFNGKSFKITNLGSGTINYISNYYTEAQTTATSDASAIASLETLITSYKSSDEYVANGNICVYEYKMNANDNINNTIDELDLMFSTITNVDNDLTLPTANETYGTTIRWATSDKDALSSSGVYGTPDKDTTVTLTATVTFEGVSNNCSFDVIVKAYYKDLSKGTASGYFYYTQSSIDTYTYSNLDIMYFAFAKISSDGSISNYSSVVSNSKSKVATAHKYGTRVLISIQQTTALSDFVTVASSTELCNTFADNLVQLINEVGFDGVDMDWEWPSSTNAPLFTSLMKIVFEKVKANNKYHLVTAALGGYQASRYDLNNSKQYLDYINLMTYDLHLSSASFHNGLYKSSAGNSSYTCDGAVTSYLNYVTADKLVLGIPFYGREFSGCTGLKTGSYNAARTYTYICNTYLNTAEHIALYRNWDSSAKVPYIFDSTNGIIISYEDGESIGYKSDYAKEKGLAGLMYWVDSQDNGNALLQTIVDKVRSW